MHRYRPLLTPLIPTTPCFMANTFSWPGGGAENRWRPATCVYVKAFMVTAGEELREDWTHSCRRACERLPPSRWAESGGGSQSRRGSRAAAAPRGLWLDGDERLLNEEVIGWSALIVCTCLRWVILYGLGRPSASRLCLNSCHAGWNFII